MIPQEQLKSTLVLESQGLLVALKQLKKDIAEIAEIEPASTHRVELVPGGSHSI